MGLRDLGDASLILNRRKEVWLEDLLFAEGPRWHEGSLYFSDFGSCGVFAVDGETRQRRKVAHVPDAEDNCRGPSGLGWTPRGELLVSQMRAQRLLAFAPGREGEAPVRTADLSELAGGFCNDLVADSTGAAYIGNFGFDLSKVEGKAPGEYEPFLKPTSLVRVDKDGVAAEATPKELVFPNGLLITPGGQALLVAETFGQRISAYKRAPDGSLSERRTWAEAPFCWPDGMCLDASGALWVAMAGRGIFVRMQEGGEPLEVIRAKEGFTAIACVLGGPDGRTLFMIESREAGPEKVKANGPGNSRIVSAHVDVPGASSPIIPGYFAGYC